MDYESVKYVEGFVENIIFRNEDNGYTVFNIVYDDEEITCVGVLSYINTGEFITAQGEFVKHAVYYMQFKVTSYEFRAPDDAASVRRYLSSGAIKGIGEKMAERIVKTFGDDTFRIMEEEPERLAEIKGISMSKAMDIANQLIDKKDIRKAMMFLQRYGIQMNLANKIFKRYGNDIYNILEQNPYRLADDIEGVGFRTADEIASRAGIKIDSEFRIKSGIFYVKFRPQWCLGRLLGCGRPATTDSGLRPRRFSRKTGERPWRSAREPIWPPLLAMSRKTNRFLPHLDGGRLNQAPHNDCDNRP